MKTLLEKEIGKLRYEPIIDYDITKNGSLKRILLKERESILSEYENYLSSPELFLQFGTINDVLDWLRDMTIRVLKFNLVLNPTLYSATLLTRGIEYDVCRPVFYDMYGEKDLNIKKHFGRVGENFDTKYFTKKNLDVYISPNKRTNIKFLCVVDLLKKYNNNLVILK